MIHGIGVDLIEIDRIQALYSKQPKLVERILTKMNSTNSTISHMSNVKLNFSWQVCYKEAFSKALGTGLENM